MFENMARELEMCDLPSNSVDEETDSASKLNEDYEKRACLFVSTENNIGIFGNNEVFMFQSGDSSSYGPPMEINKQPALSDLNPSLKAKNATEKNHTTAGLGLKPFIMNDSDDKENAAVPARTTAGKVLISKY